SRIAARDGARNASAGPWSPRWSSGALSDGCRAVRVRADRLDRREARQGLVFRPVGEAPSEWRLARPVLLRGQRRDDDRRPASPGDHRALRAAGQREGAVSAQQIRELNDRFRTTMTGGQVLMTAGVNALPSDVKAMVIRRVATFSDFTADNDPHGEHDFGSFTLAGRKFFFKMDYYDTDLNDGSEDPADPAKT